MRPLARPRVRERQPNRRNLLRTCHLRSVKTGFSPVIKAGHIIVLYACCNSHADFKNLLSLYDNYLGREFWIFSPNQIYKLTNWSQIQNLTPRTLSICTIVVHCPFLCLIPTESCTQLWDTAPLTQKQRQDPLKKLSYRKKAGYTYTYLRIFIAL